MSKNNFSKNIIGKLITPVNRYIFNKIKDKYNGDYYCKSMNTWEHFISILFGQLTSCSSLRQIETAINYHSSEQYHLGVRNDIHRSTLSHANNKRDWRIFRDLFLYLIDNLKQNEMIEVKEVIKLIDSTPIRLDEDWCESNIRITGLKVHTVFSLNDKIPTYFTIKGANSSDLSEAKEIEIEPNCTYVFDRGYISSEWWNKITESNALFVSRNFRHFDYIKIKTIFKTQKKEKDLKSGDIIEDSIITAGKKSKFKANYKNKLRMVIVKRDNERHETNLNLFTNDFNRTPEEIAKLYKDRRQIELLFKWIKQNLKIKKFLGKSENAVKIQICVAMIAYVLLKIAETVKSIAKKITIKSLITMARCGLFTKLRIKDNSKYKHQKDINQLQFKFMNDS
ncbi:MAG TPA: IS4 family transposase [Rickettsiales bacterium]|nr:IS4 family transposase [Rickettsiales bacterium]